MLLTNMLNGRRGESCHGMLIMPRSRRLCRMHYLIRCPQCRYSIRRFTGAGGCSTTGSYLLLTCTAYDVTTCYSIMTTYYSQLTTCLLTTCSLTTYCLLLTTYDQTAPYQTTPHHTTPHHTAPHHTTPHHTTSPNHTKPTHHTPHPKRLADRYLKVLFGGHLAFGPDDEARSEGDESD